jgi:two-component system OmpR family response regulator
MPINDLEHGHPWAVPSAPAARPRPRVLIVEDDRSVMAVLTMGLRFLGFETLTATSGGQACADVPEQAPDVILLDVMLPDMDGFEVCRRLREAGVETPVLFLTSRDSLADKIHGLAMGGDDYVTKPFDLNEVVARIHALLRRAGRVEQQSHPRRLRAAWVELDQDTRDVWRHGQPVRLSATEFALLKYLMEHAGQVISKAQILDKVWGYSFQGESGIVETYIYYLRRKLGDTGQTLIRTVRGAGYLLQAGRDADASL